MVQDVVNILAIGAAAALAISLTLLALTFLRYLPWKTLWCRHDLQIAETFPGVYVFRCSHCGHTEFVPHSEPIDPP